MKKLYMLVFLFLVSASGIANAGSADDLKKIISRKEQIGEAICIFNNDGKFLLLTFGGIMSPKGVMQPRRCLVYAARGKLNPLWLLLKGDDKHAPELIRWTEPAKFERVWILGDET